MKKISLIKSKKYVIYAKNDLVPIMMMMIINSYSQRSLSLYRKI